MGSAGVILLNIFRQAWMFLVGAMILIAALAVLSQVLRTASSSAIGAQRWVQQSIGSIVGVIAVIVFAFLVVPVIVHAGSVKNVETCGPISELGGFAAMLIGGLGALRMLRAALGTLVSAAVGGNMGTADAFKEAAEVLLTMLLSSIVVPIAAAFLGVCK